MNVDRYLPGSVRWVGRVVVLIGLFGVLTACGSDSSGTSTTTIVSTDPTNPEPDGDGQVLFTAALADELGLVGVDGEAAEQPVTIDGTGLSDEQRQAVIAASRVDVVFVESDADPAQQPFWSIEAPQGLGEQLITVTLHCDGDCGQQSTYRVAVGGEEVKVLELDSQFAVDGLKKRGG